MNALARDTVVVFARAPALGAVKTRLARDVGDARALELYTWLGARVVRALGEHPERTYRVEVAYTPDEPSALARVRAWLPWADGFAPQGEGDLGARMERAIARGLGHGRVVVVGTDCAAVDGARVDEAFDTLARAHCVLGPADDGGYYLIGASRALPVFDAMAWSTDAVLAETRARLDAAGLEHALLEPASDVDTAADLASIAALADAPGWVRGASGE